MCVSISLVQTEAAFVKNSGWMVVLVSAHVGRLQTFMWKNKKTYEKWITSCTLAAELNSTVFTLCFYWDSNIRPGFVHVPQSLEAGRRNPPTARLYYNQPSINDREIPAHRKPSEHRQIQKTRRHWRARITDVVLFTCYSTSFQLSQADTLPGELLIFIMFGRPNSEPLPDPMKAGRPTPWFWWAALLPPAGCWGRRSQFRSTLVVMTTVILKIQEIL